MKFIREDFKRVNLEPGKYYYQIKTQILEIDIEPCAGGFCVAIYYPDQKLAFPKKCTNHEGYDQSINSLVGERREETWDKALKIAGELFDKFPFVP
ncbi:hypothetical protein [Candidatus Methanoperedens nitratireducens]|uniref:Uncharacterized protein n=1 Tax=Candidatus Methanoperedens nitratireducens TaxID=1392998 RepID=A0A284VK92_9EURY|nr:hypothetical protein [Candidatus Methanoperedens nitroreducens]SNQ59668.1 hypothetical protein MNV_1260016 [Candidatus Methanoperedens nitroreducens]